MAFMHRTLTSGKLSAVLNFSVSCLNDGVVHELRGHHLGRLAQWLGVRLHDPVDDLTKGSVKTAIAGEYSL